MNQIPVILLAFANDASSPLHELKEESTALKREFIDLRDKNIITLEQEEGATTENLIYLFNRYDERIAVFHYAGHVNGRSLLLEDGDAGADGLAQLLGRLPNLRLVFLNGCSTELQVDKLLSLGARSVIATRADVEDIRAMEFSTFFYQKFSKGSSIKEAFEFASSSIQLKYPDFKKPEIIPLASKRGTQLRLIYQDTKPIWGLFYNENSSDSIHWRLPLEINKREADKIALYPTIDEKDVFGRLRDIDKLEKQFSTTNKIAIKGISGSGKSTFVKYYLSIRSKEFDNIIYVKVSQGVKTSFIHLKPLVDHLGLSATLETKFPDKSLFQTIISRLSQKNGRNILILDDCHVSLSSELEEIQLGNSWHIVATSRESLLGFSDFELSGVLPEEAVNMFYWHYVDKKDRTSDMLLSNHLKPVISEIVQALEFHPLLIELSASLLSKNRPDLDLRQISKTLKEIGTRGLPAEPVKASTYDQMEIEMRIDQLLVTIFSISELNEEEKKLLGYFSLIPAKGLSISILEFLLGERMSKLSIARALRSLNDLGWIQSEQRNTQGRGTSTVYSCHRLIQDAARLQIPKNLYTPTAIAKSLSEVFLNPQEKFHEAQSLIDFPAFLYFQAMEIDIEIPLLLARYSWFLMSVGHYEEAAEWAKRAIDSSEAFLGGDDNMEITKVFRNTADVFRITGHMHEAKEAIAQAINLLESTPPTLVTQDIINRTIKYTERAAWISVQSGQYEEAEKLCRKIFVLKDEKGGYLDEETINSLEDLSIRIYDFHGLFIKARELSLKSWENIKNSAPANSPEALVYPLLQYIRYGLMTNKILTTISLLPQASEIVQSITNPIVSVRCLSELAYVEFELGHLDRAINRTKSALDIIDGQLQDNHPDKKKLFLHHAYLLSHLPDKESATRYLIKGWTVKPVDTMRVSPEEAFVFHVRQSLLMYNIHELQEALEQSKRAVQLLGAFKPISPVLKLQAYNTLVLCLSSLSMEAQEGDLEMATHELERSLKAFNEINQIELHLLSKIYDTLGKAYEKSGKIGKSILYFEKAIAIFDSAFAKINPGHFQYIDFYSNLALALKLAGYDRRSEQAEDEANRVRHLNASSAQ